MKEQEKYRLRVVRDSLRDSAFWDVLDIKRAGGIQKMQRGQQLCVMCRRRGRHAPECPIGKAIDQLTDMIGDGDG